ncbi:MAG: hypothetical protein ACI9DQ_000245, partial [Glaciecola sp.]
MDNRWIASRNETQMLAEICISSKGNNEKRVTQFIGGTSG